MTRYAYKASLIGAAQQFELTGPGLAWRFAGRTGLWPYSEIAAIRLSYRPVSMQAKRFRADIVNRDGRGLRIISTSWQTATLMAPQSEAYRAFIIALHERLAADGSTARLTAGLGRFTYGAALAAIALFALAMAGLLVRALVIAEWSGALFLIGFAALFAWYVGGFITRNKPRSYTFTDIPAVLLP
ncbi:hypothetical protein S58_26130 [Bradyrhizobium oligotrophicum S58]|uniref:Uncharacterized protein n=1 Tax=Bradyrhizobium oligotrophicum S58 TaxID=1245469 RepID=M4Z5R8_9BRAD|nr:hypothetical protein [Bradyrhizobium oligotrophicum]BAM88619.1 hypothetical protein S58_26130 [Bradyrhizobium oligotrophicum S58]